MTILASANISSLSFLALAITVSSIPRRDGQAELARAAGYVAEWFTCPDVVAHPAANRSRSI